MKKELHGFKVGEYVLTRVTIFPGLIPRSEIKKIIGFTDLGNIETEPSGSRYNVYHPKQLTIVESLKNLQEFLK